MPKVRADRYDSRAATEKVLFGEAASPTLGPDDRALVERTREQVRALLARKRAWARVKATIGR